MRNKYYQETMNLAIEGQFEKLMRQQDAVQIARLTVELEQLKSPYVINFEDNAYRPSMDELNAPDPRSSDNYGFAGFANSATPTYQSVDYGFAQFGSLSGFNAQVNWNGLDTL